MNRRPTDFASRTKPAARAGGFTLIELMIAISLMAVLAVLGWRGLDSVLRSRERIVEASDGIRAVSLALTQMEDDLLRSWSVRLIAPTARPVAFGFERPDGTPDLLILREPSVESGNGVQRIVYRLRNDRLERGFAPWRPAASGPSATTTGSEVEPFWQALLEGVSALRVRAWVDGQGWQPAQSLAARAGTSGGVTIVTGLEVLLEFHDGERVLRVFSVKD